MADERDNARVRRDGSFESIEFLDTDDGAFRDGDGVFGDAAFDDGAFDDGAFDDDEAGRRPRWVVPAGLTALAAVIAVSVGTGSSGTSSGRSPASTQAVATTPITLAPSPTTTDPAASDSFANGPARYVVEFPAGLAVIGVNEFDIQEAGPPTQLWATPGSTATAGKWVEISVSGAFGTQFEATADAYRIAVGDSVGLVAPGLSADKSTKLTYTRDDSIVTLNGHGVSVDFLLAVAGSLSVTDPGDPRIDSSLGVFDEFRLVDDRAAGSWLFGEGPAAGLYAAYGASDDFRSDGTNFVNVSVGRPKPADGSYDARLPFIVDPIRVFRAVDGSLGVAGPIVNTGIRFDRPVSSAHWVDDDGWLVAVVMDASVDEVIAVASTARVDTAEWQRLASTSRDELDYIDPGPGTPFLAPEPDGVTNEATLQQWRTAELTYSWRTSSSNPDPRQYYIVESHRFSVATPVISTTATRDNQFVFATVPRRLEGASLTVTVGDDPPVTVPLSDRDPGFAVLSAVFSTTTIGPLYAVLTAADGTVLTTWPTS